MGCSEVNYIVMVLECGAYIWNNLIGLLATA